MSHEQRHEHDLTQYQLTKNNSWIFVKNKLKT